MFLGVIDKFDCRPLGNKLFLKLSILFIEPGFFKFVNYFLIAKFCFFIKFSRSSISYSFSSSFFWSEEFDKLLSVWSELVEDEDLGVYFFCFVIELR